MRGLRDDGCFIIAIFQAFASTTLEKYIDKLCPPFRNSAAATRKSANRSTICPRNALLIQLDFMENMTWPLGVEEAQDWFWATSRESMTTLGLYVVLWAEGKCLRQNRHYIFAAVQPRLGICSPVCTRNVRKRKYIISHEASRRIQYSFCF